MPAPLGHLLQGRRQLRRRRRLLAPRAAACRASTGSTSRCGSTISAPLARIAPAASTASATSRRVRRRHACAAGPTRCPPRSRRRRHRGLRLRPARRATRARWRARPRAARVDRAGIPDRRSPGSSARTDCRRRIRGCRSRGGSGFPGFTDGDRRPAARARPLRRARCVSHAIAPRDAVLWSTLGVARRLPRRHARFALLLPERRRCPALLDAWADGDAGDRVHRARRRRRRRTRSLDRRRRPAPAAPVRARPSRAAFACRSSPRTTTTGCCGRATSTSFAARIRSCARSGRRGRSSGTSIRRPRRAPGESSTRFLDRYAAGARRRRPRRAQRAILARVERRRAVRRRWRTPGANSPRARPRNWRAHARAWARRSRDAARSRRAGWSWPAENGYNYRFPELAFQIRTERN